MAAISTERRSSANIVKLLALKDTSASGLPIALTNEIIVDISSSLCGDRLAIVSASGRVYTAGANASGQLGHGNADDVKVQEPRQVVALDGIRVTQVACGGEHTLFRTDSYQVYACGSNARGQLGLGPSGDTYWIPILIDDLSSIACVAAGKLYSVALTIGGRVYVWGSNEYGQLGLSNNSQDVFVPQWLLPKSGPITALSCGLEHTALLTAHNTVYMCGNNRQGQLGQDHDGFTDTLQEVTINACVTSIACGAIHTVALTDKGKVWVWGGNACGQLGFRACSHITTPFHLAYLDSYTITQVSCGRRQTALISDGGVLYKMGHGRKGQLNSENQTIPNQVGSLGRFIVKKVTSGVVYMLVLVEPRPVEDQTNGLRELSLPPAAPLPNSSPRLAHKNPPFCITRMDSGMKQEFECSICYDLLEKPIYQCENGHNVCRNCRPRMTNCHTCRGSYSGTRNLSMESICSRLMYKCDVCKQVMKASLRDEHFCIDCPFREQGCKLRGPLEDIWKHVQKKHGESIIDGLYHNFTHTDAEASILVISVWDELFVLRRRLDGKGKKLFISVEYIGPSERATCYKYLLHITSDDQEQGSWYLKKVRSEPSKDESAMEAITLFQYFKVENGLNYNIEMMEEKEKEDVCD